MVPDCSGFIFWIIRGGSNFASGRPREGYAGHENGTGDGTEDAAAARKSALL